MGIWCHLLGDLYWWSNSLWRHKSYGSTSAFPKWREASQTTECSLLRSDVGSILPLVLGSDQQNVLIAFLMTLCWPLLATWVYVYLYVHRYDVMLSCWKVDPDERPEFSDLVLTTSSMLHSLAEYLDLSLSGCDQKQP